MDVKDLGGNPMYTSTSAHFGRGQVSTSAPLGVSVFEDVQRILGAISTAEDLYGLKDLGNPVALCAKGHGKTACDLPGFADSTMQSTNEVFLGPNVPHSLPPKGSKTVNVQIP